MTYQESAPGFSLLEILISLFVVSLTAAQIISLQKMVSEQNRDNAIHSYVVQIATEKMEEVLQYDSVSELDSLVNLGTITRSTALTNLYLNWEVEPIANIYSAEADLRCVKLLIEWADSQGNEQRFIYSQVINSGALLNTKNRLADLEAAIIESFIISKDVRYFEPQRNYQVGDFVIYNSELFSVTEAEQAADTPPRPVDKANELSEGWQSYGLINNPALANMDALTD